MTDGSGEGRELLDGKRSALLREAMGEWLYDAFVAVRRAEIELFSGHTPDQVVAATRWRY